VVLAALAYAGMVMAHNGIALLFSLVLGAWLVFVVVRQVRTSPLRTQARPNQQPREPMDVGVPAYAPPFERKGERGRLGALIRAGLPGAAAIALGLGLTGIFMVPLILEYRYVNVAQWTANYYNYQDHFVELYQLFSPTWGFGISNQGPNDGLSFQLGAVPVVLSLFSAFALRRNRAARAHLFFFGALTLAVIVLMFSFSLPAWQAFGLASVAQFPWRLLTLTMVSLAVLCGGAVAGGERRVAEETTTGEQPPALAGNQRLATILVSALILLGSYPYLTAQTVVEPREGPVGLAGFMRFQQSANEMTGTTFRTDEQPRWSDYADLVLAGRRQRSRIDFSDHPEWLFIRIPRDELRTTGERVDYNAPNGSVPIIFNVQYYPGWKAYLTRARSTEIVSELPIEIDPPYGRIKVVVPQGEHGLWLRFEDTPPRIIGTIISALALLATIGLAAWSRRRSRKA
jgi:hypothetical protein